MPHSEVREGIRRARYLASGASVQLAVAALGNGTEVSAQDTVPFGLWSAAQCLADYEKAMWLTVSGLGDIDTNCAIVGGIVAMYTGVEGIPEEWLRCREALPSWSLQEGDVEKAPRSSARGAEPPAQAAQGSSEKTITLFRPVGPRELALIKQSGYRAFPPRLPEQPIFYPVLDEEYARQIAGDWNVKQSGAGYVTRFRLRARFLRRYSTHKVGNAIHEVYWIPSEDLPELNRNIVGPIEITAEFGTRPDSTGP